MPSALDSFTSQLQHVATQPNNARLAAYDSLISDLLQQSSSKLNRMDLLKASSAFLRHAVFSDQNSTGGGLVIGRQALTALEYHASRIAEEHELQRRDKDRMQDDDDDSTPAIADRDTRRQLLEDALEQLQPKAISFEEQASSLRMQLASLLESEEDWNEAARVLLAIPLDSGHRNVSDHFKLSIYVRIARLLLEGDDPVAADMYLKRASMIIHNVPGALPSQYQQQQQQQEQEQAAASSAAGSDDVAEASSASVASSSKQKLEDPKVLGLQYRLSQARVYDSQRRFSEAAIRYHELSYVAEIDEDDRAMMLSAAVTASILSPAGPQRARTLATLMRDERTPSLPQYTILSKVFLDRVIRPDEIASFEKLLSPHQIARLAPSSAPGPASSSSATADGKAMRHAPSTVLDRAMIEHNVLSASRLYDNITLAGLGALVDLSPEGAEDIARKMIMQGRLKGWIDQVGSLSTTQTGSQGSGVLFFIDQDRRGEGETTAGGLEATKMENSGGDGSGGGAGGVGEEGAGAGASSGDIDTKWTRRWDQQIAQVTGALEDVCQRINRVSATTSIAA
ncbi:Proteasome component (PCI) domain protein [Kalmanozyma brasiliensis GHG001]|uniref:COP9 signalosome complex subunit 4 n=1 Tax=Kalmanozyma brasiliensis (strain GHG001) TaxID=1365824 RepID=V5F1L7_KALBG|nr:Proteasome component (PCI) domain protein [Kalmanozyma brasiliensis GHG001]EST10223.1 Proteasome component (PCI) domain protein [Kalmanozyma brasiliensis GHG001]